MISQLTIFLENREGHLPKAVDVLAENNINMQALFLADAKDWGILRIICDTPQNACNVLRDRGYQARLIDMVAVRVPDEAGALAKLLNYFDDEDIFIDYAHCFVVGDHAVCTLKVKDPGVEVRLAAQGFDIVKPEDVYVVD